MADESTGVGLIRSKDHDYPSYYELSDLIVIQDFKQEITYVNSVICQDNLQGSSNNDIKDKMGVSEEIFTDCVENCNPKYLTHDGTLSVLQRQKRYTLPKDTGLESIDKVNQINVQSYHSSLVLAPRPSIIYPSQSHLVNCPETVLTILLYHPTLRRPQVEYLVLGSQLLTELKDILYCARDYNINIDYSDDPQSFINGTDKKLPPNPSKSGYFFINNTFYNDLRHAETIDYSSTVIDWVESNPERRIKSSRLDHFSRANMNSTKFEQLSLRLGYPYLYCHHGNCEHGIVFTDLRLLSPSDTQDKRLYPILLQYWKSLRKRCCVCEEFTACWVTVNDELSPESPAFFCKTCFIMFHYTVDGDKITEFKAYPYYDELTALLDSNAQRLADINTQQ